MSATWEGISDGVGDAGTVSSGRRHIDTRLLDDPRDGPALPVDSVLEAVEFGDSTYVRLGIVPVVDVADNLLGNVRRRVPFRQRLHCLRVVIGTRVAK